MTRSISEVDYNISEALSPHVELGHVQREVLEYEDTVKGVAEARFGRHERFGDLVRLPAAETKHDLDNMALMITCAPANQDIALQYAANKSVKKPIPHPIYRYISTYGRFIFSNSPLRGPRQYLGALGTRLVS